jgi:hypothetical protein
VLDLVACVLAQQGFLFPSARIICVGFSRSAAASLRFGLRVLDFHCPDLFFYAADVVFLLISFLHLSPVQRELGARCHQQQLGQAFPCGDFSYPDPAREPARRQFPA